MITSVIPKLPFIDKAETLEFYTGVLGFRLCADHGDYLIMQRDAAELHFFSYPSIVPSRSDFMVYLRVTDIEALHTSLNSSRRPLTNFHPLQAKPWGQKEFALSDPNGTLLTFGEAVR